MRDERGFTFPELVIATVMALIIAGAGMTMVLIAQRTQPRVSEKTADIQIGRTLIERFVRDLRQGQGIAAAAPSGFQVLTYVEGASCTSSAPGTSFCRVTYSCSSTSCTRSVANPDGTGASPPERVIADITGPNVFTYAPNTTDPNYVGVSLVFPAANGEESVTLSDGASLRNHLATGTDP